MKRVFCVTGTVKAYFVSDEDNLDRLEEIGREVLDETIEYYGTEECLDVKLVSHSSPDNVPEDDRDEFVFVRSRRYEQDQDLTVEEAFEDA